ncbi:hypothetical protein CPT_Muldoon_089 [Serratia phage Muldoon]|uniref:Uncharacterized protein n=1 Tax=Serratia phage Muldoon TaxID=2601678 RepID=A0A5P8PHB5_9CAUD|nr:hypothetical protein HYP94_gp088 [Serratia phage Muldoon]QFR56044.1 hypothetical protein CPT_Muldoon_089 [Serratia phage Muldoon]
MKLINELRQIQLDLDLPQNIQVTYNQSIDEFCFERECEMLFLSSAEMQNPSTEVTDQFDIEFDIKEEQAMEIIKLVWEWIHA